MVRARNNFIAILSEGWRQLALPGAGDLAADKLRELAFYFAELDKWSRKINLVARDETAAIIEKHFLDSLTLLPLLEPYRDRETPSLLDVGSGAGFPGLVIKIICPWLRVILVEPRQKRVSFLRHIVRSLNLADIDLREERLAGAADDFQRNYGQPDIITGRAVADIRTFLEMLAGVPAESKIICMKGARAETEIDAWQNSSASPFSIVDHQRFTLPLSGAARALIVFGRRPLE